jgi:hypothetical protein
VALLTVHSEPFIEIFAFWELYREAKVARALSKVSILSRK